MVVTATLSWGLLVDTLGWNFLVEKERHHNKMSFIEGETDCLSRDSLFRIIHLTDKEEK